MIAGRARPRSVFTTVLGIAAGPRGAA